MRAVLNHERPSLKSLCRKGAGRPSGRRCWAALRLCVVDWADTDKKTVMGLTTGRGHGLRASIRRSPIGDPLHTRGQERYGWSLSASMRVNTAVTAE